MATLTFLGAARTVTGSKYLVDVGNDRILVDCGLFQGLKRLRELNWQPLPVEAASIRAVVLTHAHLDHSGYLPRLVAQGFRGRVFCTPGTADLCRLILPDSARLQEEDARQANRHGYGKHTPSLPLYTEPDAFRAVSQLQPLGFNRPIEIVPGVVIEFISAGHLLGSAFVQMTMTGPPPRQILFGGDLGRYNRPVLPDPSPPPQTDVLLCESTYGDRQHPPDDDGEAFATVVRNTINRRGGEKRMATSSPNRFPAPLVTFRQDSAEAKAEIFLHAYQDLRRLAQSYLKHERPDHTLQATALVHEVYLRLAGEEETAWRERADFMQVAARLMRCILIDHARKAKAAKRNGNGQAISLEEAASLLSQNPDPADLNDALQALERLHPRAAQIVELRFFAGLTEEETARVLGISATTVKREWTFARAWLRDLLS